MEMNKSLAKDLLIISQQWFLKKMIISMCFNMHSNRWFLSTNDKKKTVHCDVYLMTTMFFETQNIQSEVILMFMLSAAQRANKNK